jgi:hypothetical protein
VSAFRIFLTSHCHFFKVHCSLDFSTLEDDTTTLSRNIGQQAPIDVTKYPRRMETHNKFFTQVEHIMKRECLSVCQPKCYGFFHLGVFKSILKAITKTCCIWQMSVNVCSNLVIVTCPIRHILACYLAMNMTCCHFWGPPSLLFSRHGGEVGRAWFSGCVKLATHFHVLPRLKTSEAVLPLPPYPIIFHF